jgi:vanillate O-demethylase monooxygenase subunit
MELTDPAVPPHKKITCHIHMPLTVLWHSFDLETDDHQTVFFHPTPVDPKRTRNFTIDSTNSVGDDWDEIAVAYQDVVNEQDRPIVESQRPEALPEDLAAEMHLKNVDTYSMFYRRWLLDLAREVEAPDRGGEVS